MVAAGRAGVKPRGQHVTLGTCTSHGGEAELLQQQQQQQQPCTCLVHAVQSLGRARNARRTLQLPYPPGI